MYVISKSGKPLMPCENVIARLLLKAGKAKVKRREPFTIKLTYETTEYTQPLTLGVDTGSGTAGFAVANEKNEIVYRSEIIVRNDVKHKMDQRKMNRNNRRIRKTRYRKARFNNRKNCMKKDHIFPTLISKIHSHVKEIEYIKFILPISKEMIFEVGHFNIAALQRPDVQGTTLTHWEYQNGFNYDLENVKAVVRFRDNFTCQICHGKHKDKRLEVHHIIPRNANGSNNPENLITLCHTCHKKLHTSNKSTIVFKGKTKSTINNSNHMNIIRSQLSKKYPDALKVFGYMTAANRLSMGFKKSNHWLDASIIATSGKYPIFKTNVVYIKRCNSKGDYKLSKGSHGEFRMPRGKVCGFLRYDKVKYRSKEYFIKGRKVAGGYADLMDIYGNDVKFSYLPRGNKTPKLRNMVRISARSSWMIMTKKIEPVVR